MKKIILILFISIVGQINAQHSKATAAYTSQDYEAAIAAWTKELAVKNADKNKLYIYIGNALAKMQNYSAAIAQYEKALRENYNQADVKFNIKVCRAKLNLDTENKVLFTLDWLQKIAYFIPNFPLSILLIVFGLAALILSIYLYFFGHPFLEKIRPIIMSFGAIFAILFILQSYYRSTTGFVIISQNTVGYENASFKGKSKQINEGEKVEVIDEIGQNIEIKTEADLKFWIEKSFILPI
jgi:tetratricopeptide (TPR) repeat protein